MYQSDERKQRTTLSSSTNKVLLLLLMLLQVKFTKTAWMAPYFEDTQTYGVVFQSAVGVQKISVREELTRPFKLAKINYEGVGMPSLGSFDIGDNSLLGVNITFDDNEWLLTIEKRQDYENPQQRIYSFQIYIKDTVVDFMEQGILITLENIFDNKPSITYSPSPCRVEELHASHLTNCIFNVYDPDGMDRNNIRILTSIQNNEDKIFDFVEFGDTTTYQKSFKLRIKEELHYEEKAIYNLKVNVYDASNNTGDIFAILEVIDLPNQPPIWVRPLTTATFDEKQAQYFNLKAIDGDTGINKPICYRLEFEDDYSSLMSINATSGVLYVAPIDRDALNQQIFTFYTCAYKCDNLTWSIRNMTILVVQDINDHIPEITIVPDVVRIMEAKYLTLPLDRFLIEDMDLGINATYNVSLQTPMGGIIYSDAFSLIPNSGYQKTNFSLTVSQADSLDYENDSWRNFEIMILAQEVENAEHFSNQVLKVELINWNDEWPIFQLAAYEVSVLENITGGVFLERVYAIDRDIDDEVIHTIVGNMPGLLINTTTGIIMTSENNIFDYERQSLLVLQIQAKDTLVTSDSDVLHSTFAQLTINIIDVNDETPELRMPRSVVKVTENSAPNTILTDNIEGRDADTTANLIFEILWNDSYATKSGQEAASEFFIDCFIIEPQLVNINLVYGILRVNPEFQHLIDYEQYDTIFLTVKLTDLNQEINENSSTAVLTIRVDDVNDNPPEFVIGTLEEQRKVTELEEESTIIGSIEGFDVDGPGNNIITFSMRPIGNLTEDRLLTINNVTGVIRVIGRIQCDIPKVYNLEYEIILNDMLHTTVGKLNISVVDINNRVPELDFFEQQVTIFENAITGYIVGQIKAHDDDRDIPHNILEYAINAANGDVHNLFQINATNGLLVINLRNGFSLDRDNGITYHYIAVDIKDNFNYNNPGYGAVNQKSTFINVTLLDINDNAPIMPLQTMFAPEFSEADLEHTYSKAEIIAEDKDEPNTPNSWVSYKIISIEPALNNVNNISKYDNLFNIEGDDKVYGKLVTLKDLKGFYGLWQIEIEAYDHGEPVMFSSAKYMVNVRPFNFHAPAIVFPKSNKSIRVCYALQEVQRPLYQADCITKLQQFTANDPDGGEYGDITFQLSSDSNDEKFFEIIKENRNQYSLYLRQIIPAGIYYLNVRATDGGGSSSDEIRNLKIIFVDMLGNPMFMQSIFHTNFTENELGLLEERFIPAAYDPKNEGLNSEDEQYKYYYFIEENIYPEEAKYFHLHSETRALRLTQTLDRESLDTLRLRIKVTNNENGVITNPNSVNYTLDVVIKVNDVNDNPPIFTQHFYAAGVTHTDNIGKEILIVHADDPDLNDSLTYAIDTASMETYGDNLEQLKFQLFTLNGETGVLELQTYVSHNAKGYFMFDVVALDSAHPPHADRTTVKIYIVSEANRVKFVFLSGLKAIRDNEKFIREEFQEIYKYEICNIDSIDDVTNQQRIRQNEAVDDNAGSAFITDVIVHFINNNEAVDAAEIRRRSTDLAFVSKLQNTLQRRNLILNDVPHLSTVDVTTVVDDWILTTLIAVCVLLALFCIVLIVVFALKMRAMKRQLKAFEPPEFGSTASNINRIGVPSTNVFSIEGSNPVINNQNSQLRYRGVYEEDTSSDSEVEDELDDLQNDPMFEMNIIKNYEEKQQDTFEHKILNNDFFEKEKTKNGLEKENEGNKRY